MESYRYCIELKGCRGHNLKNVNLELPLNRFVVVTGVSGSGKTTLIKHTLYPGLMQKLEQEYLPHEPFDSISGFETLRGVVMVSQESLGRSARSSPATVLKIFDAIRDILASQPLAKERGYTAGSFSLNVDGGRCPHCKGTGVEQVEMIFLDDVQVPCEVCDGKLYKEEMLEVTFQGKNVYEILQMTVLEAREFFVNYPQIRARLNFLVEVGLSYLRLGQSTSSLSGGEAQRLKIARELLLSSVKNHLYIFDEPTTGLHFREIGLLLKMLHRLVKEGASVLVIEHNQEVILQADFVIDLGPGSGHLGGEIVATGTPQEIMNHPQSLTGHYLKQLV
jgi:excinuclease ABC subunit A